MFKGCVQGEVTLLTGARGAVPPNFASLSRGVFESSAEHLPRHVYKCP
jgi:hypothetical protein